MTANVVDDSQDAQRLQDYQGSAEVISSNLVFHTLSKEQVQDMLLAMFQLLKPGGLLLGACGGCKEARIWSEYDGGRWLHSQQTLKEAFQSAGFAQIQMETFELPEAHRDGEKIGLRFSAARLV